MMDIVLKVSAIAVFGAIIAALMKRGVPELATVMLVCTQLAMIGLAAGVLSLVIGFLQELAAVAGISDELLTPLLKTVGIAIVTKLACDTCRDSGAGSLASYLELVGGAVALSFSMPLMLGVLKLIG